MYAIVTQEKGAMPLPKHLQHQLKRLSPQELKQLQAMLNQLLHKQAAERLPGLIDYLRSSSLGVTA